MRYLAVAALCLAACQQDPKQISFDGANVRDAAATVAHGERLTYVLGCRGCHGKQLQGQRFYELYATNLTRKLPTISDADFARILRTGTHQGEELWGMPSEIFQHLSDADLSAVRIYLRTLKPAGPPDQARLPWEAETAKLIASGEIKPAAQFVEETKTVGPADLGPEHALGRYITRVTCAECHGPKLEGRPHDTPNLTVAGGYSRPEFERLITQGVPTGNRKLHELMQSVAKNRFSHLTPHERDALYAYLKARAEQPQ